MKKTLMVCAISLLCLCTATGCWDRREINDLAIELGWGMDLSDKGAIRLSGQFIIPSKLGMSQAGGENTFFVVDGTGTDYLEAAQDMQTKLSRKIFRGHRRDLFIGEELARRGIKSIMDLYSRDPETRLRTAVFVVKGGTAEELLNESYPLEGVPAVGALKEYMQMGTLADKALFSFLSDASAGASATMPLIARNVDEVTGIRTHGFRYVGGAIFNRDLKLVGYLDPTEAKEVVWIRGTQKGLTVTAPVANQGMVSLDLSQMRSKVQPIIHGNRVQVNVTLSGSGILRENNTNLDLSRLQNVRLVEATLDQVEEQRAQRVVKKLQSYHTEVCGFDDAIHRKYPYLWKKLRKNWDEEFSNTDVTIHVRLTVKRVGLIGPPMHLTQEEYNKM